jgi:hypothetical protein
MKRSSEIRLHHGSLWTAAIDTPRETVESIRADMSVTGLRHSVRRNTSRGAFGFGSLPVEVALLRVGRTADAAVPAWIVVIPNEKPHFWQLRPEVGHPFLLMADS